MLQKVTKYDVMRTIKVSFEDGKAYRYNCIFKVDVGNIVYVEGKRSGSIGRVVEIFELIPFSCTLCSL